MKEEVRATWRKYQRHGVRTCATAMMLGFVWLVLGSFREQGRRESKRSYKKEACLDSHTYTPGMILKIKDFGSGAEQHGSHGDAVQKLYGLIGSGEGVKQGKEKGEERREEEGEKREQTRERESEIYLLCTDSLSKCLQQSGCGQSKSRSHESHLCLPHAWQKFKYLSCLICCLPDTGEVSQC